MILSPVSREQSRWVLQVTYNSFQLKIELTSFGLHFQMDIATTLLEYNAKPNDESKAGFTPLHLSSQEGHTDMSSLLIEHGASVSHQAKVRITSSDVLLEVP